MDGGLILTNSLVEYPSRRELLVLHTSAGDASSITRIHLPLLRQEKTDWVYPQESRPCLLRQIVSNAASLSFDDRCSSARVSRKSESRLDFRTV